MIFVRTPLSIILAGSNRVPGCSVVGMSIKRYVYTRQKNKEAEPETDWSEYDGCLGLDGAEYVGMRQASMCIAGLYKHPSELAYPANAERLLSAYGGIGIIGRADAAEYQKISYKEVVNYLMFFELKHSAPYPNYFDVKEYGNKRLIHSVCTIGEQAADALRRHEQEKLGKLMDASLRAEVKLGTKNLTDEVNAAYAAARIGGAWGGNIMGKFMVVLSPLEKQTSVRDGMKEHGHLMPLQVDYGGSSVVYCED